MDAKGLVAEKAKLLNVQLDERAINFLGKTLDNLCNDVLQGSEKIRKYSGKEKVDEEVVKIAAYLDVRLKNLFR